MGEARNPNKFFTGKPEGKRPPGRLRRRYEDNIKMDIKGIGSKDVDWINLTQYRKPVAGSCENDNGSSDSTKFREIIE
jgi:hypothetical protein